MNKIIGINPTIEAMENNSNIEYIEIYKGAKGEAINKIRTLASKRNIIIKYTDKKIENSQGVTTFISDYDYYCEFGEFLEKEITKEKSLVLILDGIQDPRNFGAIIRSAEIFGVRGIVIPERNSVRINETVVKTSTGAIEYVDIVKVKNISETMTRLKELGYWIYGAEATEGSKFYSDEKYPEKVALVLGSEGFGIRKKVREGCDVLIKIPMKGKINSLNVSVAGGILLSEIAKYQ